MKFLQGIKGLAVLQKPWQKLKDYVEINYDQLGLLLVEEEQLTLWEINKVAQGYKLKDQRSLLGGDEDFWQQASYSLLASLPAKVPVIVIFHTSLTVSEQFSYPMDLKLKEIHNSLAWDIKKLPANYIYARELRDNKGEYAAVVRGVEASLVDKWQGIIKSNQRLLWAMVVAQEDYHSENIKVSLAKALIEENREESCASIASAALAQHFSLLPKNLSPCKYEWHRIAKFLIIGCLCMTGLLFGFWQINLHNLSKASEQAQANSQLKQQEMAKINQVKVQTQQLQTKLALADKIRAGNKGFYGIVQALATANVEGVALNNMQLTEGQLTLEGDSFNYALLNEYQGNLQKITRLKKLELVSAQRVDNEKIHFVIQGEVQ